MRSSAAVASWLDLAPRLRERARAGDAVGEMADEQHIEIGEIVVLQGEVVRRRQERRTVEPGRHQQRRLDGELLGRGQLAAGRRREAAPHPFADRASSPPAPRWCSRHCAARAPRRPSAGRASSRARPGGSRSCRAHPAPNSRCRAGRRRRNRSRICRSRTGEAAAAPSRRPMTSACCVRAMWPSCSIFSASRNSSRNCSLRRPR